MKNKSLFGFTLIELIIVIVILGILAAVAVPIYTNAIEERKGEVCINNMRVVFAAWRAYNLKNIPDFPPIAQNVFLTSQEMNQKFGTSIDEKYFGTGTIGFGVGYYFSASTLEDDAHLRLYAWKNVPNDGSIATQYIDCFYYYKRTVPGTIFIWSGSNWPWKPPNE